MYNLEYSNDAILNKKINQSIRLLKSLPDKVIEVSYSGGKDSDVILELAKMSGIKFKAIHKVTTIDPPYTIQHCINKGAEIIRPKYSMMEIIKKHGFPTRRSRHCCSILKEYPILEIAIQGIRRSESHKRKSMYKEPIICRNYGSKTKKAQIILPILEWTDNDVEKFIIERNIQCSPIYYENGYFDVTKRLGCMGCPLASDNGLKDFKRYPKLVKIWINAGLVWWHEHPCAKSRTKFNNIYELFVHNVFFNSYEEFKLSVHSPIYGEVDCKKFLETYFSINL